MYDFLEGATPESILQSFPLIGSLERVYGAITFYLANKAEIDDHLKRQEEYVKKMREENPPPADLKARLLQRRLTTCEAEASRGLKPAPQAGDTPES